MKVKNKRITRRDFIQKAGVGTMGLIGLTTFGGKLAHSQKARKIRMGISSPIELQHGIQANKMKAVIEAQTDGKYIFDLFPNNVLGGSQEMAHMVSVGTLDMAHVAINNIYNIAPVVGIANFPFLFNWGVPEHWRKCMTGPIGETLSDVVVKQANVRIIGHHIICGRHVLNRLHPCPDIESMRDLKLRVPKNPLMLATWKNWGCHPVPVSWPETFPALQTGTIDGLTNGWNNFNRMHFCDIAKYCTEMGHSIAMGVAIINEDLFRSLPVKDQEVFRQAGIEAEKTVWDWWSTETAKSKKSCMDGGVKVIDLKDVPNQEWLVRKAKEMWPEFYNLVGDDGEKLIKQIDAEMDKMA
jgi:TRAP-type C4-dicarboxylate transport system substrate-binding protein